MVFIYNAEQGLLVTALSLKDTVIPSVVRHAEFWAFLILHLVFKLMFCAGLFVGSETDGEPLHVSWKNVKVITAITTLLAVFYSNQSYSRYLSLYDATRDSLDTVYDFAYLCKLTFQESNAQHMRLTFRFYCASVYIGLHYAKNVQCRETELDASCLLESDFLRASELAKVREVPVHDQAMLLQEWSCEVLVRAMELHTLVPKPKPGEKVDFKTHPEARPLPQTRATMFFLLMMNARKNNAEIVDTLQLPVPFQYFHILSVMILVNIALWCYKMALNYSVITIFVFLLAQVIFMGMLELAVQLSCPFGDDDVDFPLDAWINEVFRRGAQYIEDHSPGFDDGWEGALAAQGPLRSNPGGHAPAAHAPAAHAPETVLGGSTAPAQSSGEERSPSTTTPSVFSPFFGYAPMSTHDDSEAALLEEGSSSNAAISQKTARDDHRDISREDKKMWRRYHTEMSAQSDPRLLQVG